MNSTFEKQTNRLQASLVRLRPVFDEGSVLDSQCNQCLRSLDVVKSYWLYPDKKCVDVLCADLTKLFRLMHDDLEWKGKLEALLFMKLVSELYTSMSEILDYLKKGVLTGCFVGGILGLISKFLDAKLIKDHLPRFMSSLCTTPTMVYTYLSGAIANALTSIGVSSACATMLAPWIIAVMVAVVALGIIVTGFYIIPEIAEVLRIHLEGLVAITANAWEIIKDHFVATNVVNIIEV